MPELTTPVGRMVGGSIYKLYPLRDNAGNPRMKQDGTPLEQISFGVAIKKGAETHWNQTEWGKQIYDAAVAAFPNGETQQQAFSWKITDGDSQIPNKNMKKPCEQPGYPGCWVLWFSQSWVPTVCNADGTQLITEENAILPGYWVQVMVEYSGNGAKPPNTPGVYLNPKAVALAAYDTIIETQGSVDVSTAGFGGGDISALSATASTTPVGGMPTAPPAPNAAVPPQGNAVTQPPQPDFAAGPPAPNAVPQPPAIQVTPLAGGQTWEQLQAAGWTVETARQQGMIV